MIQIIYFKQSVYYINEKKPLNLRKHGFTLKKTFKTYVKISWQLNLSGKKTLYLSSSTPSANPLDIFKICRRNLQLPHRSDFNPSHPVIICSNLTKETLEQYLFIYLFRIFKQDDPSVKNRLLLRESCKKKKKKYKLIDKS